MKSNRQLKQEAKETLSGNWGNAVLMNIIPFLLILLVLVVLILPLSFAVYNISGQTVSNDYITSSTDSYSTIISFGSSLISTFFGLAMTWTFLDMLRKSKSTISPLKDIFRTFKLPEALGILVITILIYIFTFLWTLLLIIPGIIKSYSYSQAFNIYYDSLHSENEPIGYLQSIKESRQLMHGHKWNLFLLRLSFIGWHILAMFSFFIGYLWLIPYISATEAAFYNELSKENN